MDPGRTRAGQPNDQGGHCKPAQFNVGKAVPHHQGWQPDATEGCRARAAGPGKDHPKKSGWEGEAGEGGKGLEMGGGSRTEHLKQRRRGLSDSGCTERVGRECGNLVLGGFGENLLVLFAASRPQRQSVPQRKGGQIFGSLRSSATVSSRHDAISSIH